MDEDKESGLTPEEAAYFESEGETHFEAEQEVQEQNQAPEEQEEQPQPEEVEQPQQARDEKGRFVPHQALHAEREEHRKTRAELNELRERQARLDERWQIMQAQRQEPEGPELPPDDDPLAKVEWVYEQIRRAQEQNTRHQQELTQRQQQEQQTRQVTEYVDNEYAKATQEDPSVQEAFQHAFQSYQKELEVLGWRGPQLAQQLNTMLQQFQLTAAARMRDGESLSDFIRGVAETRGWKRNSGEPNLKLPDGLKKVADAQKASKTIGKVQGSAGGDEMSIDDLANMPQDEFNAWMAKPANEAKFRRLMGG